jgi:two-component system cell cycle response regulator DivK
MAARVRTVLLVEDHEDNIEVYRTMLEHQGYRVLVARDGAVALESARRDRPDLILLDLSIPRVSGWEVARRLKAESGTASIHIIAVTAKALESDRETAFAAGCDGYLAKPVPPSTIAEEVRKILGPPDGAIVGG